MNHQIAAPAVSPSIPPSAMNMERLAMAPSAPVSIDEAQRIASTTPFYGGYVEDTWRVRPNLSFELGLRYERDVRTSPLPTDNNNIAPRFSFSWSPFGDRRTAVRGGYGVVYSPTFYQIDWSVRALNDIGGHRQIAQVFSSIQTPGAASAQNIFTTLRRQGVITLPTPTRALTPQDLLQFGLGFAHTGTLPPFSILFENSADFRSPYGQQASLALERQITDDFTISLSYVFVKTLRLPRSRDRNLLPAPVEPRLGIPVWSSNASFADPAVGRLNVYESTARALYSGMIVEAAKRFSRSFSFSFNYVLSRAMDDVADYNSDFQAFDQTNQKTEWALSSFDQRHRVVAYGIWTAPGSVQISPMLRGNSSRPFNLLAGFDLNADRHDTTDRPAGAGRNTGIDPSFWTLDSRVARSFALGEHGRLEFMAEAFNVLNRLNLASVNNVVGNVPGPFRISGRHDRTPSEPLGFTSAQEARRIQLGVRVRF